MVILSIYVIPVIWRFDEKIRFWFILSAVTFIIGAIGMEMLSGWTLDKSNFQQDSLYYIFITFEESIEITGLIMLVYALLSLLQTTCGGFSIHIPRAHSVSLSLNKSDESIR